MVISAFLSRRLLRLSGLVDEVDLLGEEDLAFGLDGLSGSRTLLLVKFNLVFVE